jgi:hypothetical protein
MQLFNLEIDKKSKQNEKQDGSKQETNSFKLSESGAEGYISHWNRFEDETDYIDANSKRELLIERIYDEPTLLLQLLHSMTSSEAVAGIDPKEAELLKDFFVNLNYRFEHEGYILNPCFIEASFFDQLQERMRSLCFRIVGEKGGAYLKQSVIHCIQILIETVAHNMSFKTLLSKSVIELMDRTSEKLKVVEKEIHNREAKSIEELRRKKKLQKKIKILKSLAAQTDSNNS